MIIISCLQMKFINKCSKNVNKKRFCLKSEKHKKKFSTSIIDEKFFLF